MPFSPPPPAMIFDLDGTLVDTVPARIEAWLAVFGEVGIPATGAQLGPLIGMDGPRLAIEVAQAAGTPIEGTAAEAIDHRAGELFDEVNRDPQPLPGARDALAMLDRAGVTWAIATSSRAAQVSRSVDALRLERPPRVVDGSSVEHAKPAPDLLLLAAQRLELDPVGLWYVGDSTWDMRAADAAQMLPIGVLAGAAVSQETLNEAGAKVIWRSLRDLRAFGWA
ncbi:MAG TPA: HAD family hydrolase [Candidatus Limnocylindria bacterium]